MCGRMQPGASQVNEGHAWLAPAWMPLPLWHVCGRQQCGRRARRRVWRPLSGGVRGAWPALIVVQFHNRNEASMQLRSFTCGPHKFPCTPCTLYRPSNQHDLQHASSYILVYAIFLACAAVCRALGCHARVEHTPCTGQETVWRDARPKRGNTTDHHTHTYARILVSHTAANLCFGQLRGRALLLFSSHHIVAFFLRSRLALLSQTQQLRAPGRSTRIIPLRLRAEQHGTGHHPQAAFAPAWGHQQQPPPLPRPVSWCCQPQRPCRGLLSSWQPRCLNRWCWRAGQLCVAQSHPAGAPAAGHPVSCQALVHSDVV